MGKRTSDTADRLVAKQIAKVGREFMHIMSGATVSKDTRYFYGLASAMSAIFVSFEI